ncbi:hypothetical protein RHECNPAF_13600124 [Rhizobium etli CNPAF512]|nr:hypothetical protein RHECNPAF_13600124 [Rhizobium etli CNPAF512]
MSAPISPAFNGFSSVSAIDHFPFLVVLGRPAGGRCGPAICLLAANRVELLEELRDGLCANLVGELVDQWLDGVAQFLRLFGAEFGNLHAGFLDLLDRLGIELPGNLALIVAGFRRGRLEDSLFLIIQAVPELPADEHDLRIVLVTGHRHVLLHLEELRVDDVGGRVLLTIDGAGLERGIELGVGEGYCIGAEAVEELDRDRRLDRANLQALDILEFGDGMTVVGQVAKTEFPISEADETGIGQQLHQAGAEGAVHHLVGLFAAVEEEGQIDGAELLDVARENAGIEHRHLDDAALQSRYRLDVAAEYAARKQLDLDLAAALFFHQLGEFLHAHDLGMALVVGGSEFEAVLADFGHSRAACQQGDRQGQSQRQFCQSIQHVFLPE